MSTSPTTPATETSTPAIYSAVRVAAGRVLRLWFEEMDDDKARGFAVEWNLGLEGRASPPDSKPEAPPEYYDLESTQRLLGGISRKTIYRELVLGHLERVPHLRRVLITRASILRWHLAAGRRMR